MPRRRRREGRCLCNGALADVTLPRSKTTHITPRPCDSSSLLIIPLPFFASNKRRMMMLRAGFRRFPLAMAAAVGSAAVVATKQEPDDSFVSRTLDSAQTASVAVPRWFRTMGTAALVAADYKAIDYLADFWGEEKDSDAYRERQSRVHKRSAQRILDMSMTNGGIWVKLCQYVSTLRPMVPEEWTSTMEVVQDGAVGRPYEEVATVLEQDLGARPDELFAFFEKTPIASASIAQVHRAVTHDGERVAVKVQYPRLRREIGADIFSLRMITRIWGWFYPDYDMSWILPEFEESLLSELDFRQEAVTTERCARMVSGDVRLHVPAVRWDLTSERVMGSEWIDGVKPTRLDDVRALGADPSAVASLACSAFADLVMLHGIIHTDPHPGNLFVRSTPQSGPRARPTEFGVWKDAGEGVGRLAQAPQPSSSSSSGGDDEAQANDGSASVARGPWQLVILDHGMYRRLSPSFRQGYCSLWEAMLVRDEQLGHRAAVQLGLEGDAYDALSLALTYRLGKRGSRKDLRDTIKRWSDAPKSKHQAFMQQLPRDFLFVSRNINLVRGLNVALGGTTQQRVTATGEAAVRGMALNLDVHGVRELFAIAAAARGEDVQRPKWWWTLLADLGVAGPRNDASKRPAFMFCRLNEPTDSEIAAWLRTPQGFAALDAAARDAAAIDPETAVRAVEADARRQRTPESNMQSFSGILAAIAGESAASAAGYDAAGTSGATKGAAAHDKDATVSQALVASAVDASKQAQANAAASHGVVASLLRSWGAWLSVLRVRATIKALDFALWASQVFGMWVYGIPMQANWGELGGARTSGDEDSAEAASDDEDEDWANTAPSDATDAEKQMHADHLKAMDKSRMG